MFKKTANRLRSILFRKIDELDTKLSTAISSFFDKGEVLSEPVAKPAVKGRTIYLKETLDEILERGNLIRHPITKARIFSERLDTIRAFTFNDEGFSKYNVEKVEDVK